MATSSSPCVFFRQGRCKYGDACRFSHSSDQTAFRRVLHGALVRFGDGACVTSLSLASEYSSARLDGLPAGTTPGAVMDILDELGHDIEVDDLKVIIMPQSPTLCSVYINTPNPNFAETLEKSIINTPYENENWTVVPVAPRLPDWASTRQVRCNKVQMRWCPPEPACCFRFTRREDAVRVVEKFNSGRYKVDNRRIVCGEPTWILMDRIYTVNARELPYPCTKEMLWASIIDDCDTPLSITMTPLSEWERTAVEEIKRFLHLYGKINFFSESKQHLGGYHTLSAHFEQDNDARAAAGLVEQGNYAQLSQLFTYLTARLVYTSTFRVTTQIFHHIKDRLRSRLEALDAPPLVVSLKDGNTVLSMDSCSSEQVAICANVVEEILAGILIEDEEGKPFWVPELASNGRASKALKEIQEKHAVLLLPNWSKREIRYFGDVSQHEEVQREVVHRLTHVTRRYVFYLDGTKLTDFCKDGRLSKLKSMLGDDVVSLNITSNPKELVITAPDNHLYELALRSIDIPEKKKPPPKAADDCSVCLMPADDPVVLGCGHTYCTDCLKLLCRMSKARKDACAVCVGRKPGLRKCKSSIPLNEIHDHVDSATFEQLLESSLKTYITRRLDQFQYCPTPDCGHIYRTRKDIPLTVPIWRTPWHMCPKCLKIVCRDCLANHEDQTCDEYRAHRARCVHRANAEFEAYKTRNAATTRDCPNCGTTIEKITGCDHMTCGGCHIHICWVCMQTFSSAEETWAHDHSDNDG